MEFDVKTCVDGTCAIYDISNLSDSDMNLVKSLPEVQMVYLYDKVYNVSFSIEPEYNKLVITIMQVK